MSDPNDAGTKWTRYGSVMYLVLVLLSIGGIAVMDFGEGYGFWYWLAMVPIFAAASIALARRAQKASGGERPLLVRRQLLHWGVLAIGVLLIFLLLDSGDIDRAAAGLVALLALAIATALAGVHFEWRLGVLGAILAVTLVAAIMAEHFFWVLLIPAVIAVAALLRWRGGSGGDGPRERPNSAD